TQTVSSLLLISNLYRAPPLTSRSTRVRTLLYVFLNNESVQSTSRRRSSSSRLSAGGIPEGCVSTAGVSSSGISAAGVSSSLRAAVSSAAASAAATGKPWVSRRMSCSSLLLLSLGCLLLILCC
ncbi:unnamed protein product, partial [Brassica oleracea]